MSEKKIKIVSKSCTLPWLDENDPSNIIKQIDKEGNRYYKVQGGKQWTIIPSQQNKDEKGWESEQGFTIEEAYCNVAGLKDSSEIPNSLTI